MELYKNTANAFIEYLKKHGYPEDRIVTEWGNGKYRIDIAVLDNNRAMPVAIYEVKGTKTKESFNSGLAQLRRYMDFLGYPVEAGLVFSKSISPFFEFVNLSGQYNDIQSDQKMVDELISTAAEPISYENIRLSAEPKIQNSLKKKKERKLNTFNIVSWVMAFVTFVFLVLEFLGIIAFTTERMIVYGIVILLTILPFYSELKFGDLSLKRESKNQSKELNHE